MTFHTFNRTLNGYANNSEAIYRLQLAVDDYGLDGTASADFTVTVVYTSYTWAYAVFGIFTLAAVVSTIAFLISVLTV